MPKVLAPLTLTDTFQSRWKMIVNKKVLSLGFSPNAILAMSYVSQRKHTPTHLGYRVAKLYKCSFYFSSRGQALILADHLINVTIPKFKKALNLMCFHLQNWRAISRVINGQRVCWRTLLIHSQQTEVWNECNENKRSPKPHPLNPNQPPTSLPSSHHIPSCCSLLNSLLPLTLFPHLPTPNTVHAKCTEQVNSSWKGG